MTEHTKEPWFHDGDAVYDNADCVGDPIIHVMSCAYDNDLNNMDARRIVACVNALEHISTETLEAFNRSGIKLAATEGYAQMLEQQRDQLLVLLNKFDSIMEGCGNWPDTSSSQVSLGDLAEEVRQAIAAVKGE